MPACGQAVGCGVCDTPELWCGAADLCARVRACAGAAESLHTYIPTNTNFNLILIPTPESESNSETFRYRSSLTYSYYSLLSTKNKTFKKKSSARLMSDLRKTLCKFPLPRALSDSDLTVLRFTAHPSPCGQRLLSAFL